MQRNKCNRQIGPVVEQGLTTGDKLALRVEDVEQRGEPFAVQRVGLAKRGFALLGRFGKCLGTLAVGGDRDQRVFGFGQSQ